MSAPIAEVGTKAKNFDIFGLPEGRRLATSAWPKCETFHALARNVAITYRASRMSAWALSMPSVSASQSDKLALLGRVSPKPT